MRQTHLSLIFVTSLVFSQTVVGQGGVDSGGGKSSVGSIVNHGSLGGAFASGARIAGDKLFRSGLIEILYVKQDHQDVNGNGLPDTWENLYFGDQAVNPQADADGDGYSNLAEYIAGTNPRDNASRVIAEGSYNGSAYTLTIQTIEGHTYKVYASRDLISWHLQNTYTGDGSQKVFNFDETGITSGPLYSPVSPSNYFFRVEITISSAQNITNQ